MEKKVLIGWIVAGLAAVIIIVGVPIFSVGCTKTTCDGVAPPTTDGHWECVTSGSKCACKHYDASGALVDSITQNPLKLYNNPLTIAGGIIMLAGIAIAFGSVFLIVNPNAEEAF